MKNKKTKSRIEDSIYSFKDIFLQIAGGFVSNLFEQMKEQVAEKTREILYEVKRTAITTFLILFGIVFLFVGLANVIDFIIGVRGVGYLFIGFVIMFFGFFMSLLTRRR